MTSPCSQPYSHVYVFHSARGLRLFSTNQVTGNCSSTPCERFYCSKNVHDFQNFWSALSSFQGFSCFCYENETLLLDPNQLAVMKNKTPTVIKSSLTYVLIFQQSTRRTLVQTQQNSKLTSLPIKPMVLDPPLKIKSLSSEDKPNKLALLE